MSPFHTPPPPPVTVGTKDSPQIKSEAAKPNFLSQFSPAPSFSTTSLKSSSSARVSTIITPPCDLLAFHTASCLHEFITVTLLNPSHSSTLPRWQQVKLNCVKKRKLGKKYVLLTFLITIFSSPCNSLVTFLRELKWGIITSYSTMRALDLLGIYPCGLKYFIY